MAADSVPLDYQSYVLGSRNLQARHAEHTVLIFAYSLEIKAEHILEKFFCAAETQQLISSYSFELTGSYKGFIGF
jgi:hypothetical protein